MKAKVQKRILELVANGKKGKDIAKSIGISLKMVDKHLWEMRIKHHAENTTHLVAIAFRNGLIK